MWRSIAVIVGGFVLIGVLSIGSDLILQRAVPGAFSASGATSSVPILILTLVYVGVFATLGCYLTARFAPSHPMRHALILGALGLAFTILGTMRMWDRAPAWYNITSLLLVMPYAWLGGWLRERQLASAPAAPPAAMPA